MSQTTFPERLRMALAADRRHDQQIATSAKVSEGQLSRWKNGHVVPELPNVQNLVRELGISGHWLLTGEGPMRPDRQADSVKIEVIGVVADEKIDLETAELIKQSVQTIVLGRDEDVDELRADTEGASPFGDGRGDQRKVEPK